MTKSDIGLLEDEVKELQSNIGILTLLILLLLGLTAGLLLPRW